jgi:hypothetical protein
MEVVKSLAIECIHHKIKLCKLVVKVNKKMNKCEENINLEQNVGY